MTAWLLTWLWQGIALAGGVAVAVRCIPRLNAATKYLIWCALLVAIAWTGWASSPYSTVTLKSCATDGPALQPCPELAGVEPVLYIPSAPDLLISLFIGMWAAVALVNLVRLLPSLHAVYALRDRCRPFPSHLEAQLPLWLEAKTRGRRTDLTVCGEVPGATVLGFQRPCIAIPPALIDALTPYELDQVILHEHAHVQRRDDWARLVQALLMSILWIHPAALLVSRALNREREMACDEWVVARTGQPKAYARCLAHAAEVRGRLRLGLPLVPAFLGGSHDLVRRVDRLLASKKARRSVSLLAATASACAIIMLSAHLQGMHVFAEIGEILLPHVPRPGVWIHGAAAPVRLSAAARPMQASFGETRRSLGGGGKPDNAPDAPEVHMASADKPDAATAVNLFARAFPGAYSPIAPNAPSAPNASAFAPESHIASADRPGWGAMATPGIEIASAAKKTSAGIAGVFSRAGVSLARRF